MRDELREEVNSHLGEPGASENGWLVSYADMTTLMFGLFVILFSLAHDKTKSVDEIMEAVSRKYFQKEKADRTPVSKEDIDKRFHELQRRADEVQKQEQDMEWARTNLEGRENALKTDRDHLESEKKNFSEEREKFKIPDSPKETTVSRKRFDDTVLQLKTAQATIVAKDEEIGKLRASVNEGRSAQQNYIMVLLSWETPKHDLDLEIKSPSGKKFNFKKREFAGEPGKFEIDSRFGPGIEMWKAVNFAPGEYSAKISLYNKNGNESPPKFRLGVTTNQNSYYSTTTEFPGGRRTSEIRFTVDDKGNVQFSEGAAK